MKVSIESHQKKKIIFCVHKSRWSDCVGVQKLTKQIPELQFSIKYSAANSATKFKENSRNSKKNSEFKDLSGT